MNFISGMPRAGSTLLSALLRQNAGFHADITSPLAMMVGSMQGIMSGRTEFHSMITPAKRLAVLRGLFSSYYDDIDRDVVVFDTNRSWTGKLSVLFRLYPEGKMIVCVRPLIEVIESVERIMQKNALEPSRIFEFAPQPTVYARVEKLMSPKGLVGSAYNALKEAFFGPYAHRLLFLQYETLASDPQLAMNEIYAFLDQPPFPHDFENISFDQAEFDSHLGTPGLHRVKPRVARQRENPILPPDLRTKYAGAGFWAEPEMNVRKARVV
jgi:sulfotransferase